MAGLSQDKRSGNWFLYFRLGGKAFNRSTSTQDEGEAEAIRTRVELRLRLLEQGLVNVPPEAGLWEWLKSDGKRTAPINLAPRHPTLSEVIKQFFDGLPPDTAKEQGDQSWREVQRLHCDHFLSIVANPRLPLLLDDWQKYIAERARGRGKPWAGRGKRRRKKPTRGTISKEVATVRMIYDRYAEQAGLDHAPTDSRLVYPTGREKPPFMTWEQIEQRIGEGGLSEGEEAELWDAVYLDPGQAGELLAFIAEKRKKHDFFYPLVFTAAATGARASELRRALVHDYNRETRQITLRERKKKQGEFTLRTVPVSAKLAAALVDWFDNHHPGGRFAFCREVNEKLPHRSLMKTWEAFFRNSRWAVLRGFHVLRHSFASNLAALEVDQRRIDQWMGHQTEAMRKRYQHLRPIRVDNPVELVIG